jgi:putative ABC transport system permease protein
VNEAFANRYYPGQNPVGRILMFGTTQMEIVGLAGNSRMMSLREERDVALAYTAMAQWPTSSQSLRFAMHVTDMNAAQAAAATRFRTLEPRLTVELKTMRDEGLASITRERLLAWTAGLLALLGLVMSLVGLYGTFTYAVRRRRIEMGVRLAVGATPRDILQLVMRDAALSVVVGALAGIAIAAASARFLAALLFGIGVRDPLSYAAALAALASAALIATYLPARRASRIDPVVALRQD